MAAAPLTENALHAAALVTVRRLLESKVAKAQLRVFKLGNRAAALDVGFKPGFDARAQAFVANYEYEAIRSLTARQAARIQAITLEGVREGLNERDQLAKIRSVVEGNAGRVRALARTELNRAANWGRYSGWKESGVVRQKEVVATHDERVREDHLAADGERVPIDEPFTRGAAAGFLMPPFEPNCLPGSERVSGVLAVATRMRYAGRLVRVRTSAGSQVSATPNHPILTPDGFVPLGAIREGSHVLSHEVHAETIRWDAHEDDKPPTAAEVFGSMERFGRFPVVGTAFHGDASVGDGYVDVVATRGPLWNGLETGSDEGVEDGEFAAADVQQLEHPSLRPHALGGQRVGGPAPGMPRRSEASLSSLLPVAPAQFLSFGSATELDASLVEAAGQAGAATARRRGKRLEAFTADVSFDEVTQVRNLGFDGHVYDFQARQGAYWANGIALHNCRCTASPVTRFRGLAKLPAQAVTREIPGVRAVEESHIKSLVQAWNQWPKVFERVLRDQGVVVAP